MGGPNSGEFTSHAGNPPAHIVHHPWALRQEQSKGCLEQGNSEPVNFLPIVGALVHRPPELPADYGDRKIVALIEKEIWAVEPKDCSLCKTGSERVRPKVNWAKLTGKS